jgi:epoxide hydrolase 4
MALDHRFVETNGVRLHCAVQGDGTLVILLHGFPECWYSWRHQIAALAPRFRVVAPDLRGYNESDKPRPVSAYAMTELVADVKGLVEAFGERQAIIVGHDWGGVIAWHFAMAHPEMTHRLAVMNAPHPARFLQHLRSNPRQLVRSWYMFFFQIPWLPETLLGIREARGVGKMIRNSATVREAFTSEDLRFLSAAANRPGALRSALNYYRAAFRWVGETPKSWPKITAPTLLLWGKDDVALGRELTLGMEPLFTGPFEITYIPHCGHWIQQEQARLVNEYLLEFLMGGASAP